MSNLFAMLNTGASGVIAAQAQLDVTGHNVANMSNPNYSRQRANLVTSYSYVSSNGAFGTGVNVASVTRVYDEVLAKTVRTENSSLSYWENSQTALSIVKIYFNELENGSGLGESMQNYFDAWQQLANTATDGTDDSMIRRTNLMEKASLLCTQIRDSRNMFETLKNDIDYNIKASVNDINTLSQSIAELNKKIVSVEADGQNANDLRDARDAMLSSLSSIVGINTVQRPNGEIGVYMAGEPLVDGARAFKLEAVPNPENDGHYDVVWKSGSTGDTTGTVITGRITGGTLQSNINMRDTTINKYIADLDELASTLIYETNKVHVSGQGLDRYTQLSSTNSVQNPTYKLNDEFGSFPYDVSKGTFQIKVYDSEGKLADTYNISVDPSKDTLASIGEKISNAGSSANGGKLQALVNNDGTIKITVADGYTLAFGDDTSGFLVAAGFNNFFSGTDSATMDVDQHIKDNPRNIAAASQGGEPGNNENAILLAEIKLSRLPGGSTIDEFYAMFVGKIATDKQQVDIFVSTKTMSYTNFQEKLEQVKGVSESEEAANLIQIQKVLQANSRYITAIDEMLNVIVNSMGLVGR